MGTTAIDRSIANYALEPSLALDSSNNPIVAWEEQLASGDSNIYSKRWNGSSWVLLGNILDKVSAVQQALLHLLLEQTTILL